MLGSGFWEMVCLGGIVLGDALVGRRGKRERAEVVVVVVVVVVML